MKVGRLLSCFLFFVFLLLSSSCAPSHIASSADRQTALSERSGGSRKQVQEDISLPDGSKLQFLQESYKGYFTGSAETLSPGSVFVIEDTLYYLSAQNGVYSISEKNLINGTQSVIYQSQTEKIKYFIPMLAENKLALFFENTISMPDNITYKMNSLFFYDIERRSLTSLSEQYSIPEKYCVNASYSDDSLYVFTSSEAGQYVRGNTYHIALGKATLLNLPNASQTSVFLCGNQVFYVAKSTVYMANGKNPEPVPLVKLEESLLPFIHFYDSTLILMSDKKTGANERYIMQVDLQSKQVSHWAEMEVEIIQSPWNKTIKITNDDLYLLMQDTYFEYPDDLTLDYTSLSLYDFDGNITHVFPNIAGNAAPILADCCVYADSLYYTSWSMEGDGRLHELTYLE